MLKQPSANTTLLEFYRQLVKVAPILFGRELQCTFVTGDGTTKSFSHNLGRPWRNAFIGHTNNTSVEAKVTGLDPNYVTIELSGAADVTYRLWVY